MSLLKSLPTAILLLLLIGCGYSSTHDAYERLAAESPSDRSAVLRLLPDFSETQVTDPERMVPLVRDAMGADERYVEYSKYSGYPIVVIYDEHDNVMSLWPAYE